MLLRCHEAHRRSLKTRRCRALQAVQFLKDCDVDGALIVTTPQDVSIIDVRKEINFCKKASAPTHVAVAGQAPLRSVLPMSLSLAYAAVALLSQQMRVSNRSRCAL